MNSGEEYGMRLEGRFRNLSCLPKLLASFGYHKLPFPLEFKLKLSFPWSISSTLIFHSIFLATFCSKQQYISSLHSALPLNKCVSFCYFVVLPPHPTPPAPFVTSTQFCGFILDFLKMEPAYKNSLYRLSIFQKNALDIMWGENSVRIYITLTAQAAKLLPLKSCSQFTKKKQSWSSESWTLSLIIDTQGCDHLMIISSSSGFHGEQHSVSNKGILAEEEWGEVILQKRANQLF